ncbi:MAG: CDP-glycerol glycerophosphotransferase family protein [Lachnospiraceae bacterium]|nr:CDP-glycerol glycerophosphotransferase family protein [Lachnospiraceae bacterium]
MGDITKIEKYLEEESVILAEEMINNRLRLKKILGEKINVLFICHRPQIWNSLKTVYQAFKEDEKFDVKILAIPNKKQLPDLDFAHDVYESEGAEEYWAYYDCICGYNYESAEWVDPRTLKPDYVFFQTAYDVTRPKKYKSWIVSKYAKICFVTYGYQIAGGELFYKGVYNETFLRATRYIFAFDPLHYSDILSWLNEIHNITSEVVLSGNPRNDLIRKRDFKPEHKMYTALWTPRWCTDENNCFFFEYKDKLLEYCADNSNFQLIFRPHPQAFLEWEATGELSKDDADIYKRKYENCSNARIDWEKDYLNTFDEVDCFITDMTSLMAEYLLTGKPIIYCHRVDLFTEAGRKMAEGYYWVYNFEELEQTLAMLQKGEDPLKEKRIAIVEDMIYRPINGAGNRIKEIVKKDAIRED